MSGGKIHFILAIFIIALFFFSCFSQSSGITQKNSSMISKNLISKEINDSDFDEQMKYIRRVSHFPSLTVCTIKNDTMDWANSYGFSNVYSLRKSTINTVYRIGSNTKCITATAIMQLYEKGLIGLDDDINEYLGFEVRNPNYPNNPITIRMLLSHQSSIYDYFIHDANGTAEVLKFFPFPEDAGEWIKGILIPGGELYLDNYWMGYPPGEHVRYCSIGFIMLGYILEQITGMDYEDYVMENIFIPLKMHNSSFYKEDFERNQIAVPYVFYGNKIGVNIPLPHISMNCFNPMSGMFTSIEDLSHFFIAHMNGGVYSGVRILEESTVEEMHRIQHPDIDEFLWNVNYALGWLYTDEFICPTQGHGGIFLGYFSNMMFDSLNNTGIIFIANTNIKSFMESEFDLTFEWAYREVANLLLKKANGIYDY